MKNHHKMQRPVAVQVVNGFVSGTEGGNPAGVVLDADGLSEQDMQSVAGKVGLSETAFVSHSETEGFKLDFFTPNRRIAHCGHATIAAFSYLAEIGRVGEGQTSKETVDGPRKIIIREGAAYMEQLAPAYRSPEDWLADGVTAEDVYRSLGLAEDRLDDRTGSMLVNTGNSFIVVAVKDEQTLAALKPDFHAIEEISKKLDLVGYYVFTTDRTATDKDATTRMFAPRYAIEEESATGMAAGPLACLLYDRLGVRKDTIVIEQGHYMASPSPSMITVELSLEDGRIVGLMAGGCGRVMKHVDVTI